MKNNFKTKDQELLTITMEECGELIQACSKAIRCNTILKNDSLIEEIGDVYCMIELLVERGVLSKVELNNSSQLKKLKLIKYSNLFGDYNETQID